MFICVSFSLKAFKRKILIYCIISISLALYLFSIIGSVRINDDEDSTVFVAFTQPTDDFESLGISNMFLWPYMYIASPIGNLQIVLIYISLRDHSLLFLEVYMS